MPIRAWNSFELTGLPGVSPTARFSLSNLVRPTVIGCILRGFLGMALVSCSSGGAMDDGMLPDPMQMVPGEALALQDVQPSKASTAGGTELRLRGAGFVRGATVAIDGVQVADVTLASAKELVLKVPARLGAFGRVPLLVQNPDGKRVVRNDLFSYVPATVSFAQRVDFAVQKRPLFVAAADMNGDQRVDLVVSNSNDNSLSLLFGNGDGSFATQQLWPTSVAPHGLVLADMNGDRKLDVVVACHTAGVFDLFFSDGEGHLSPQNLGDYKTGSGPIYAVVGDVNSDGKPDAIVSNFNANQSSVHVSQGGGKFAMGSALSTGTFPFGSVLADFNEDGKPDYAVVNRTDNNLSVFLGKGDGTFAARSNTAAAPSPIGLAVGDVNGDGHQDLVSASTVGTVVMPPALSTSKIVVHLGRGDGTFSGYIESDVAGGTRDIQLGDLNADGVLDVAVAAMDTERLTVLLGKGDGSFPSRFDYVTGGLPSGVAIGLFNADPRPDIAVSNSGSNTVSVFLNASQ